MKKIVILFSGTGTNMRYILENMHQKDLEVVATVTNNPNAKGIEIAKSYSIPVEIINNKDYPDRESFDKKLVSTVKKYSPDLTVLAGFMRILTPVFTKNIKSINLHPSLLPRHRGLNAIEKSYEDEYSEGGVTVHWVTSELDAGEIIVQRSIPKIGLSYEEYYKKIRTIEKEALSEAILTVLEKNN